MNAPALSSLSLRLLALALFAGPLFLKAEPAAGGGVPAAQVPMKPAGIIRTPPASHLPRINGAGVFGVRPEHPVLYRIPATGIRPMTFSADHLPPGLVLDAGTGMLTGSLSEPGEYLVTLHARNAYGEGERRFRIVVGESIGLTPAMGWNSWNHYGARITQEIVLENAKALVDSGLVNHGWSYINIDDGWQGARGGAQLALQGNEKFPDIRGMCSQIHAMGLRFGLYSTPWTVSYADFPGSSSASPDGSWTKPAPHTLKPRRNFPPYAIGRYHFAARDAQQWADWGVDYLKYDWNPIELPETIEMYQALRSSGRDILLSLSNHMKITLAPSVGRIANSWRTTGDIQANWESISRIGFGQDAWSPYASPGHWNDADMLEIATAEHDQPGLSPDEEYTHMSLWCLLSSPLLIANDLTHMDAFTRNLLENDEVIAVNQDSLGLQAVTVAVNGDARVLAKRLEDGSVAVGLFNTGMNPDLLVTVRWSELGVNGPRSVRDLWRQKDLGDHKDSFSIRVASHGAELVKIWP